MLPSLSRPGTREATDGSRPRLLHSAATGSVPPSARRDLARAFFPAIDSKSASDARSESSGAGERRALAERSVVLVPAEGSSRAGSSALAPTRAPEKDALQHLIEDYGDVVSLLEEFLALERGHMHAVDVDSVGDYLRHGEWGFAHDCLRAALDRAKDSFSARSQLLLAAADRLMSQD